MDDIKNKNRSKDFSELAAQIIEEIARGSRAAESKLKQGGKGRARKAQQTVRHPAPLTAANFQGRWKNRRQRAHELQARMLTFSRIYNAAYQVREAYFGPELRRLDKVMLLIATLTEELQTTQDYEALLYAVVDALYASPTGVPWEP